MLIKAPGEEYRMWTVRCVNDGEWRWYLHRFMRPGAGAVYPNAGKYFEDEGAALVMCDAFNVRDFGEIDPAPYKGYWRDKEIAK